MRGFSCILDYIVGDDGQEVEEVYNIPSLNGQTEVVNKTLMQLLSGYNKKESKDLGWKFDI